MRSDGISILYRSPMSLITAIGSQLWVPMNTAELHVVSGALH
jgi:hypothetical protein